MIRNTATVILAVLFGQPALAASCEHFNMSGLWELKSARYEDQTGKVLAEVKDGSLLSRKWLVDGKVSFVTWHPDGKFEVAASGLYEFKDGLYLENIEVSSLPRLVGKNYRFNCQISDGVWLHSGQEDHLFIFEYWQRSH
ncbi:hypothetical protein ACFOEE_03155 [Pseudoalteromonas fenneropenaei]|uniref:DUF4488 domain-containing protein n=1 Tax=Pseudoalteromonas fenneropenaei TaxID=1737459 RepID=A0ABV7CG17_9GAMM